MDGEKITLFELFIDLEKINLNAQLNIWLLLLLILLMILLLLVLKNRKNKNSTINVDIVPVKLKYKIGGAEAEYQIIRSYQNLEIAHKIYIELITRKAAIEIEEDKDVIVEIYDSWYTLFKTTRIELKSIKGKLLLEDEKSQEIVRLLTDILNEGLRPHLTEYQAKFRKWYYEALKNEDKRSPQEIQKDYVDYSSLMDSIKDVNKLLIQYANNLKLIINGKR